MKAFASLGLSMALAAVVAAASNSTTIPAKGGDITITGIQHAWVQIEHAGKIIQVDPAMGDAANAKPGDLVLVTDIHPDHLNPDLLAKARKSGATVVMPEAVQKQAGDKIPAPVEVMANGQTKTVDGIKIEAVPMYNLKRGPAAGQLFHTKGRGNGYILTIGGKRIYIAGDTECTPEMKAVKNIDVALVPMNLPYTMPPSEAAACVKAFHPKVAIPYHYQGQNTEEFKDALKGTGIDVRLVDMYPGAGAGK